MLQSKALRNRDVLQDTFDELKTPLKNGHPPSADLKKKKRRATLKNHWTGLDPVETVTGEETRARGHFQSRLILQIKCTVTTLMSFLRCRNIWIWEESWCRSLTSWNWSCEMTPPWKRPGIIHLQLRPAPWGQLYPLLAMAQQLWNLNATTLQKGK